MIRFTTRELSHYDEAIIMETRTHCPKYSSNRTYFVNIEMQEPNPDFSIDGTLSFVYEEDTKLIRDVVDNLTDSEHDLCQLVVDHLVRDIISEAIYEASVYGAECNEVPYAYHVYGTHSTGFQHLNFMCSRAMHPLPQTKPGIIVNTEEAA